MTGIVYGRELRVGHKIYCLCTVGLVPGWMMIIIFFPDVQELEMLNSSIQGPRLSHSAGGKESQLFVS